MKKFLMLLVVCMCTGLVIAGCGDDKKDDSSSDTPAATTATPAPSDTGDTGGAAADPAVQTAIDTCKQGVEATPTLDAGVKEELINTCESISSDPATSAEALKKVCLAVVDSQPDNPGKATAEKACDQATATP